MKLNQFVISRQSNYRRFVAFSLAAFVVALLTTFPQIASAALPTVTPPSGGSGGSGLFGTLQNYAYDGALLLALLMTTGGFIVVGSGALAKFHEARNRGEWGEFIMVVVIGVLLIVALIWLADKAVQIL